MSRSKGQATVELIVVFLGFAALFLGLFELTRLYQAKHVLAAATFAAARAGALHHGAVGPMNAELANQMSVLLIAGRRSAGDLAAARAQAIAVAQAPGLGVEVVSPVADGVTRLSRPHWLRLDGQNSRRWLPAVANDNLKWRPRDAPEQTIQDANVLRVRSLWCHRLVTPGLDRIIAAVASSPFQSGRRQQTCTALSEAEAAFGTAPLYVAISSDAAVRLQSPLIGQATAER